MHPPPAPFPFAADQPPAPRAGLFATLARIDGWGPGAWREIHANWRLRGALLAVEDLEAGISRDDDDRVVAFVIAFPDQRLGRPGQADGERATCDWLLRHAWRTLLARPVVTVTTHQPGAAVRATNACRFGPLRAGESQTLILRLLVRLPLAGMCCDGKRLARFLRAIEAFAADLNASRSRPTLAADRRAVAVQTALRAALPAHGLIAFVGDGARLARGGDGGPLAGCRPWRTPRAARTTIDLGTLGRVRGLGIRTGVTAVAGAPYHGKSTLLAALAAGREDHPPGDGRELVVADASALQIQAEDGRRIKRQDLSLFFARLPGSSPRDFSTTRASGATSMGASLCQGIAAGCRLLLVDEDTAASNFLTIDPLMRRLLGHALDGTTTLLELLPNLARAGVSTVLVAGSNSLSLAASDRVLLMEHYQPNDASTRVRRMLGRQRTRPSSAITLPVRTIADAPDCLFGPRHFLAVDANEAERPLIGGMALDLRRSGWELDRALVRGALAAAAWCCRLADGQPLTMPVLAERYRAFVADHGARGLDPFDTALITVPPWQLVVSVLERMERPLLASRSALGIQRKK